MSSRTVQICALNDRLRQNLDTGLAVMTPGIAALGPEAVARIVKTISVYDARNQCRHQRSLFNEPWWAACCGVYRPGRPIGLGPGPDRSAKKCRSRRCIHAGPSQYIRRGGDSKVERCCSNQRPDLAKPMVATTAPISLPFRRGGRRP